MFTAEQKDREEAVQPTAPQAEKKTRTRGNDNGAVVLSHMEHFVHLARKVRRTDLLKAFLEGAQGNPVPLGTGGKLEVLRAASRNVLFGQVAESSAEVQDAIETGAERIGLLCEEFGRQAVLEMLEEDDAVESALCSPTVDSHSRALYLYLRQEYPTDAAHPDRRFDRAEDRREMLSLAQSSKYSSHFRGPKGVMPRLGESVEAALLERLAERIFGIEPNTHEIVLESFVRKDRNQEDAVRLYTVSLTFNGSRTQFQQVVHGEVVEHDEPSATRIHFAWEPAQGALIVFCDNPEIRPDLAVVFRDVVLGGGDLENLPIREFSLLGFLTPAMLERIKKDRVGGVEGIQIQHIQIAKPRTRRIPATGHALSREVISDARIRRHRYDDRDIYQIAREDYHLADLTGYEILQVRLTLRIAKTPLRRAHNVTVVITSPNGLNDRSRTQEDSDLIFRQLVRLDCAREY